MGPQEDQLDEEAIENYYRNRYNEDTAAIARLVQLDYTEHLSPLVCMLLGVKTRDEVPALAQKTGFGALYLKRRWIFKSLLNDYFR